jgi:invasion protein IalB
MRGGELGQKLGSATGKIKERSTMTAMDRWTRFCGRTSCAVLAGAVAVGLAASVAMAQDAAPPAPQVPAASTQPKATAQPKPAPAAQQPAGAAPGQPAAAGQQQAGGGGPEDSAWVKLCMKNEQTQNKQICLVNHEGLEPNTGMVLIAVAVRSIEGEEKKHLLARLPTAYSLVMPAGVQIKIDEDEPIPLQYAVCFPTSCQVQMELTPELFEKMRKGKQMIVAAINMQQKTMPFPVPLTGFSKAFDGPPVDNAQYEAARRQMMEKFRERQAELAAKAKEAQAQPGAAPGAPAAPAPAAPNASAAPAKTQPAAPAPAQ